MEATARTKPKYSISLGTTYGYLTAVRSEMREGRRWFLVECVCGETKWIVHSTMLIATKKTRSCGCKRLELLRASKLRHGCSLRNSPEFLTYIAWQGMLWRCTNKNRADYASYGGRGITVCERWASSFENFLADMGHKPAGHSLGRIDNDAGYSPSNCRWENATAQARNKRTNHVLIFRGRAKTIAEWAEKTGIRKDTLRLRIVKSGWTVHKALTTPTRTAK